MRFGLKEEIELTIADFINGISPKVTNKVNLQPYLSLMMFTTLLSILQSNLKVENPSKPHPSITYETLPRVLFS